MNGFRWPWREGKSPQGKSVAGKRAIWFGLAIAVGMAAAVVVFFLTRGGREAGSASPGPGVPGMGTAADLYFADAEGDRLAIKRCPISSGTPEETLRAVVEELVLGPRDSSFLPTIPPATAVRAVFLRGDTAYVDFSSALPANHPGGSWSETLTVYSIVNSVAANVPGVRRVQILVEGKEGETLAGHIVLDRPLAPQPRLLDGNL